MIGRPLAGSVAEEASQRPAVVTTPGNATLTADVFEIPDEDHPKVDARRQALAARLLIVRLSSLFQLAIEIDFRQQPIQTIEKHISRPAAKFLRRHPECILPLTLSPS